MRGGEKKRNDGVKGMGEVVIGGKMGLMMYR